MFSQTHSAELSSGSGLEVRTGAACWIGRELARAERFPLDLGARVVAEAECFELTARVAQPKVRRPEVSITARVERYPHLRANVDFSYRSPFKSVIADSVGSMVHLL